MSTNTSTGRSRGLEVRSIDYVPLNERHGKVSHIGPLWFMSNAQIATLAVGLISITTGGNLIWSMIAIAAGVLLGTLFMAAHSSQGPQLGLPQMIQSRPQFGYVGALLVWLFAYLQYAGFNIFNTILAGQSLSESVNVGSPNLWFWIVTIVAVVVALFGYDLIHGFERYLTYLTIAMLALLTITAILKLRLLLARSIWPASRPYHSWASWGSPPATRSRGPSTSRITPATCLLPPAAGRSSGRSGAARWVGSG